MEITNINVGNFKYHFNGRDVTMMDDRIDVLLYLLKYVIYIRLLYPRCFKCAEIIECYSCYHFVHISYIFHDVMMTSCLSLVA